MKTFPPTIFLTLIFLTPVSAHATARDDVMSSAYHCARIGDTRLWLNCYYGSAQPARDLLGLSPAPAEQIRLATQPPYVGEPTDAGIRDEVMARASACYTTRDDREWLNCYYGAAQPIRSELGLSPAPQMNAASAARSISQPLNSLPAQNDDGLSRIPQARGGDNAPPAAAASGTTDITSRMASYNFDHYGIFTVTLTNGQVWRQLSGDTSYAHWNKAPGNYLVHISSGFLGSRKFEINGIHGIFRVRRIK